MKILHIVLLISTIAVSQISAQACCTAGTPILSSLEMSTAEYKTWKFGVTYQYNSLKSVYDGSDKLEEFSRERITQSALIEVNYGLFKRFTITALFSYINQQRLVDPVSGNSNKLNSGGIGDFLLLAKYKVINLDFVNQREFAIGGGIKAPLGKADVKSNGILLPADIQPGTGSWDGVFWSYFSQGFSPWMPLTFTMNVTFRVNGTYNRFGSGFGGYKFGNEFATQAGLGYRTDSFFDITMFIRYRYQAADQFTGADIENTGGNWLELMPGINFKIADNFTARLTGQMPIYRNLKGTQLTTTFTTSVAFYYTIKPNLLNF